MNYKARSIQKILFTYFLFTMLFLLILATLFFSVSQYINLRTNTERDISRTCSAIAKDIDLQISQMDTVCLNTIHSSLIKDTFSSYINSHNASPYELNQYRSLLASTLISLKGVDSSIRQINLYGLNQGGYGAGNYTGALDIVPADQHWYQNTLACHGYCYIPSASQNPLLSRSTGTDENRYYLSLYRLYYDDSQNPAGFVEVMKYYDVLFNRTYHPNSDYNISIMIYDSSGNLLFPLNKDSSELFDYYSYKDLNRGEIFNTLKTQQEYVYYSPMPYSGFTAVATINSAEFFAPIYRSLLWTLFIFLLVFLLCYLIASILARKLSAPIKKIYHFLSNINSQDQFREIQMEDSKIIEIDKLWHSLNEALRSQKASTDSMMLLKEQELQAHMLALQSQMNPHFLYNSLNTIGAMAEEGMIGPVSQMCRDITSILRYISSNKEQLSSLEEELEHCDLYLKCMKMRFGDALTYHIDVDDEMLDLPIPKLCIQLLVENATKFTTNISPPWHITIDGHREETYWYIDVKDNGPGFTDEITEHLKAQMNEILKNGLLPNLELDGMGILNIFIRLYLIYGITFIFDFGNCPEGGAVVRIGGRFDDENKPL